MLNPLLRNEAHGFRNIKVTPQALGAAALTDVVFTDADLFDPHNWHNPGGGTPEQIIPDEPGLYDIHAQINFAAIAVVGGDVNRVRINIGGAKVREQSRVQLAAGTPTFIQVDAKVQLAAGAIITVQAYSLTGNAGAIVAGGITVHKVARAES